VLLADLVTVSARVASTASRSEKVAALAGLLRALPERETEAAVGLLVGEPRQGRVGVGWATLAAVEVTPSSVPSLAIADVDETLTALARTSGRGAASERELLLGSLLVRATLDENGFLRRLLGGELRQGALEGVMADAVAHAAGVPIAEVRRAAMLSGDLRRTARLALAGGADALRAVGLEVLRPVQPMLAAPADGVADALARTGLASVEWKLDGARIQVHRAGDDVRVFTRNLNDVTERLPEVVDAVRALRVERTVLDGEAIGLADDARPRRFQDTMSAFGREEPGRLRAFLFDCLHVDGDDLLGRPLGERLAVLEAIAPGLRVPAVTTAAPGEAERFLESALGLGHEGIVVKSLDAPYEAGRRGGAWRKVKPVRTLDLVVLGAEWGHGRRHGWLSNLHLGARDPAGGFVMVGKTFKGLTDELLAWQTERLEALASAREGIVVRVRPELVVEIALDGVQASSRYPGGVALRFARVRRYRADKSPLEADTIATVRGLLR
jgi:DNA ligase-1